MSEHKTDDEETTILWWSVYTTKLRISYVQLELNNPVLQLPLKII